MKKVLWSVVLMFAAVSMWAHCQIPCGIYNDDLRFELMEEDINTVQKSTDMILKLQQESPVNYNQLVRWIENKDKHAENIQQLAWYYFLAQRVAPPEEDKAASEKYLKKIELLHKLIFYAMKAKQNVDAKYAKLLHENLDAFKKIYREK